MKAEPQDELNPYQPDIETIAGISQIPAILETTLLATGMGFAAIARVTDSRWIACATADNVAFGLKPGDELDVQSTLCHEVRELGEEIVIDDVESDPTYCDHHTPEKYGFRSYVSVPIVLSDGSFFGTLCALDSNPRKVSSPHVMDMFRLFARIIGESVDTEKRLRLSEQAVDHEHFLAGVQERFIAILAHDLRNPVAVLRSGFRMMETRGVSNEVGEIVTLLKGSVNRMSSLIENLLDQARTRMGAGIIIEPMMTNELLPVLRQIVAELNAVSPRQRIKAEIDLPEKIRCDSPRVAQLMSNLLANAVTHGTPDEPILLKAEVVDGTLNMSVANKGAPISDELRETLFQPFSQGSTRPSREGLGLGLFIAAEIAKGHGGTLDVTSEDGWTTFHFTMPNAV